MKFHQLDQSIYQLLLYQYLQIKLNYISPSISENFISNITVYLSVKVEREREKDVMILRNTEWQRDENIDRKYIDR